MSDPVPASTPAPVKNQTPPLLSSPEQNPVPSRETSWLPWIRSWGRDLAVAIVIAGVIIVFFYQPVKVEGTSMMPRLSDQERIFINKFVYRLEEIHRGDVVVFRYPGDPQKSYIKRVIGLPGDTVEIIRGVVYVNEQQLKEPYVIPEYRGSRSAGPWQVGEGNYYVLGDHRNSSNDSRSWGTVPRSYIYGKAELIYWPLGRWGLLD